MASVSDLAIDLGTSTIMIYMKGKGIVLREPTVIAIDRDTHDVIAFGSDAARMIGRTPGNILALRPLRDGTISDYELVSIMLKGFVMKAIGKRVFVRPRAIMALPTGVNEMEKRSIISTMLDAGMRRTQLLDRTIAAALGAGLPIDEAYGSMIVDISAGVSDIAVLSMGKTVVSDCVKIGGDKFNDGIIRHLRRKHNLLIGELTAEELKRNIGSAIPRTEQLYMEVTGRNLITGLPKTMRDHLGRRHRGAERAAAAADREHSRRAGAHPRGARGGYLRLRHHVHRRRRRSVRAVRGRGRRAEHPLLGLRGAAEKRRHRLRQGAGKQRRPRPAIWRRGIENFRTLIKRTARDYAQNPDQQFQGFIVVHICSKPRNLKSLWLRASSHRVHALFDCPEPHIWPRNAPFIVGV